MALPLAGTRVGLARSSAARVVPTLCALVLATVAVAVPLNGTWSGVAPAPVLLAVDACVVAAFTFAGLFTWRADPASRLGPLLLLVALAYLVPAFGWLRSPVTWTFAVGVLADLHLVVFGHLVLAFPSGRLTARRERVAVAIAYGYFFARRLAGMALYSSTFYGCPDCPANLLAVAPNRTAYEALQRAEPWVVMGLLLAFALLAFARWRGERGPTRWALGSAVWTVGPALLVVFGTRLARALQRQEAPICLDVVDRLVLVLVPLGVLVGWLYARLTHARLGELVRALQRPVTRTELQGLLGAALGDPGLRLLYRRPDGSGYLDVDGTSVDLIGPSPPGVRSVPLTDEAVALVDERRVEPELVEAVTAAARMALENARLQARVRAQLDEAQQSRQRLARDLHDGAQQRLVYLSMTLGALERQLTDAAPTVRRLVRSSADELDRALAELRELARGAYPAILADAGLAPALRSMADRCPLPVTVDADERRWPEAVEAALYFVAAEALTNVVKHAAARRVAVTLVVCADRVVLTVTDDGVGGASVGTGGGLDGLRERIEALGGRLEVISSAENASRSGPAQPSQEMPSQDMPSHDVPHREKPSQDVLSQDVPSDGTVIRASVPCG